MDTTNAEKILNSKKVKKGTKYAISFDGSLIKGFNGKFLWNSERAARESLLTTLTDLQLLPKNFDWVKGFDKESDANMFIEYLLSSGRLEFKQYNF